MQIIVDSREQLPWGFDRWPDVEVRSGTLDCGDYSLRGLESAVAIERKGLGDLVACLGAERSRFERELCRLRGLDVAAVIVEADWRDVASGQYRSRLNPRAAVASVAAFAVRYCPFYFAGDRDGAELLCYELLAKYAREVSKRYAAAVRALEANSPQERDTANLSDVGGKPTPTPGRTRQRAVTGTT